MSPHGCGTRWRREGDFTAVAEPDRAIPEPAAAAPGPRKPARATRGEARRDRRRNAGLQEHRHAPRATGRSRGAEEGTRGAQGNADDPREVVPEAVEVPRGALRGPRGEDSIGPRRRDRGLRDQLSFSPEDDGANPYIGTSLGEL